MALKWSTAHLSLDFYDQTQTKEYFISLTFPVDGNSSKQLHLIVNSNHDLDGLCNFARNKPDQEYHPLMDHQTTTFEILFNIQDEKNRQYTFKHMGF